MGLCDPDHLLQRDRCFILASQQLGISMKSAVCRGRGPVWHQLLGLSSHASSCSCFPSSCLLPTIFPSPPGSKQTSLKRSLMARTDYTLACDVKNYNISSLSLLFGCLNSACTRFGARLPTSEHSTTQPRQPWTEMGKMFWLVGFDLFVCFYPVITSSLTTTWSRPGCFAQSFLLSHLIVGQTKRKSTSLPPFLLACAALIAEGNLQILFHSPPLGATVPVLYGPVQAEDGL